MQCAPWVGTVIALEGGVVRDFGESLDAPNMAPSDPHSSDPSRASTWVRDEARSEAPTMDELERPTFDGDPLISRVLDSRYHVLARAGSGGMASVYRACQLNVDRDVALKVLNSVFLHDPQAVQRFETEARIISKLRHPNTLKLIDFGRLGDGRPYLVTEFLVGETLDKRLGQQPCDVEWTLKIMRQICDSLTEAHDQRVVHRDLKPANIFLERVGEEEIVRVLDFGIAKLEVAGPNREHGSIFGTPAFMSPEQACGEGVDGRSDLYALGVVAYYALTATLPFVAATTPALLMAHVTEAVRPMAEAAPGVEIPEEVEALVRWLLEKDLNRRPPNARAVRDEIDRLLQLMVQSSLPSPSEVIVEPDAIHDVKAALLSAHAHFETDRPRRGQRGRGEWPLPRARQEPKIRRGRSFGAALGMLMMVAVGAAYGSWWVIEHRDATAASGVAATEQAEVEAFVEQMRGGELEVPVSALPAAGSAALPDELAEAKPARGASPRDDLPSGFVDFEL